MHRLLPSPLPPLQGSRPVVPPKKLPGRTKLPAARLLQPAADRLGERTRSQIRQGNFDPLIMAAEHPDADTAAEMLLELILLFVGELLEARPPGGTHSAATSARMCSPGAAALLGAFLPA